MRLTALLRVMLIRRVTAGLASDQRGKAIRIGFVAAMIL